MADVLLSKLHLRYLTGCFGLPRREIQSATSPAAPLSVDGCGTHPQCAARDLENRERLKEDLGCLSRYAARSSLKGPSVLASSTTLTEMSAIRRPLSIAL